MLQTWANMGAHVAPGQEDDVSRVEQFLASQEGQTWAATYKWTGPDATKLLEEKAATWEAKWVAENKYMRRR